MVRFAESLSTEEIKDRIRKLSEHKVIKEIDLYLKELRYRKKKFQFKIFNEMVRDE